MEKWKEIAEKFKTSLEQERKKKAIRVQEEKKREEESQEQREKSRQLAIKALSPRIKKVCRVFARAIGGYLWDDGAFLITLSRFEVRGPLDKFGLYRTVEVEIFSDGVLLITEYFNDFLISKYTSGWAVHRSDSENLPNRWWNRQVTHFIPIGIFDEDRLAEILEEFCRVTFSPEAKREGRQD